MTKKPRTNEYIYIYMVKIIAAILVSWGHLIGTSTWQTESIWGVITKIEGTSLLPPETQVLWKLEYWFYNIFHVQAAVVGVVLFFLVSGFVLPHLQEKYNVANRMPRLLVSRMERIYPVTIVCTCVVGMIAHITQHINFSMCEYISTAFVVNTFTGAQATMGVLWYLMVLMFLYIISSIFPRITLSNLTQIYMMLYILVMLPRMLGEIPGCWIFSNIEYVAKFAGIPLLGSAAYLIQQKQAREERLSAFVWFFSAAFLLLKLDSILYGTEHTYTNIWTYIFAFIIIAMARLLEKIVVQREKAIQHLRKIEKYLFHFYLVHVGVGFTVIYYAKHYHVNSYVCVILAYFVSACVAVVSYQLSKLLLDLIAKTKDCIINQCKID